MALLDDSEIARRLLHHLARGFGCADALYAAGPVRIQGGFDTAIFGFTLDRVPPALQGPLILRLSQANADPARGLSWKRSSRTRSPTWTFLHRA
jgi:hypothetical protein